MFMVVSFAVGKISSLLHTYPYFMSFNSVIFQPKRLLMLISMYLNNIL